MTLSRSPCQDRADTATRAAARMISTPPRSSGATVTSPSGRATVNSFLSSAITSTSPEALATDSRKLCGRRAFPRASSSAGSSRAWTSALSSVDPVGRRGTSRSDPRPDELNRSTGGPVPAARVSLSESAISPSTLVASTSAHATRTVSMTSHLPATQWTRTRVPAGPRLTSANADPGTGGPSALPLAAPRASTCRFTCQRAESTSGPGSSSANGISARNPDHSYEGVIRIRLPGGRRRGAIHTCRSSPRAAIHQPESS